MQGTEKKLASIRLANTNELPKFNEEKKNYPW